MVQGGRVVTSASSRWAEISEEDALKAVRLEYGEGALRFFQGQLARGRDVDVGWGYIRLEPTPLDSLPQGGRESDGGPVQNGEQPGPDEKDHLAAKIGAGLPSGVQGSLQGTTD